MIEGIRGMTPADKLEQVELLRSLAKELAMSDVRRRHPGADERDGRLRLASRHIPHTLMIAAFGWDPAERGY